MKEPLHVEKGIVCLDGVTGAGVEWVGPALGRYAAYEGGPAVHRSPSSQAMLRDWAHEDR